MCYRYFSLSLMDLNFFVCLFGEDRICTSDHVCWCSDITPTSLLRVHWWQCLGSQEVLGLELARHSLSLLSSPSGLWCAFNQHSFKFWCNQIQWVRERKCVRKGGRESEREWEYFRYPFHIRAIQVGILYIERQHRTLLKPRLCRLNLKHSLLS